MNRFRLLAFALVAATAFVAGRATGPDSASATSSKRVYTGRIGDVFRAPSAAVRCLVSQEGGAPELICAHTPAPRYGVTFFKDNLFVYRNGNPDNPVFSAKGKP